MHEQFIGLSKKRAQNLAEFKNLIFRLVSLDGERYLGEPEDVRNDRVCVEVVDEKVVKAEIK